MHLLHVSDLHFRQPWFHWLREQAPLHDGLIISGDLLDHRLSNVPAQIEWTEAWLRASPVPVVVCSGNHDLQWDAERYRWQPAWWLRALAAPPVYPDGTTLSLGGLDLAPIACTQQPRKVAAHAWIVHTPPAGTAIARTLAGLDRGDSLLTKAIVEEEPAYVFSGHVHDPENWHDMIGSTRVFNPGANPHGRFPNHIRLDMKTGEAHRVTDRLNGRYEQHIMVPALVGGR